MRIRPRRHALVICASLALTTTTVISAPTVLAASKATKAKKSAKATTTKQVVPATTTATTAAPVTIKETSSAKNPGGGKSVLYLSQNESQGFNPATATKGNSLNGMRVPLVLDNMFLFDAKQDLVPRLGLSMTTGGDGKTWTIKLRPNVKFSDGTVLDSSAIKANLEFHQNAANRSIERPFADQIDSITTPDPLTTVLNLKAPDYVYDIVFTVRLGWMVSPKALREKSAAQLISEPVGAGPYLLDQWVRDDRQVFKPNPNYWDSSATVYDKIEFRNVPDARQRIDTFAQNKDADLVYIADENSAAELQAKGFKEVDGFDPGGGIDFRMQTTKAPFDDVRMRQAMLYAVDRANMNQVIYKGKALLLDDGLVDKSNPLFDAATTQPAPNPSKAQQLIDSYMNEKNGGKPVTFTITTPTALRLEGEFIQQTLNTQFKNVNVRMELLDAPSVSAKNAAKDFQAELFSSAFVAPEVEFFGFLRTGSTANVTGFSNSQMDSVLDKMKSSKNIATRKANFVAAQQILFDQVPFFYLRRTVFRLFYKDSVKSVKVWHDGKPIWTELEKA